VLKRVTTIFIKIYHGTDGRRKIVTVFKTTATSIAPYFDKNATSVADAELMPTVLEGEMYHGSLFRVAGTSRFVDQVQ
jgi:hypothetical protein